MNIYCPFRREKQQYCQYKPTEIPSRGHGGLAQVFWSKSVINTSPITHVGTRGTVKGLVDRLLLQGAVEG